MSSTDGPMWDLLARAARVAARGPARDRMTEIATVGADAMSAREACVYLTDQPPDHLIRHSKSNLEPRTLTVDEPHFIARAAATRDEAFDGTADAARAVAVPLVVGDELLGVLVFAFDGERALTLEERRTARSLADIAALAAKSIDTRGATELARLRRTERASRAIMNSLEVVPKSFVRVAVQRGFHLWPHGAQPEIPEFLRATLGAILDQARAATEAEFGALGIGTNTDRPFDPWVFSGVSDELVARVGRMPRPVGVLGLVAVEGETLRIADVREHPAYRGVPEHHPEIRSLLATPLCYGELSLGNLYLANKRSAPEFTADDEEIVRIIAAHGAQALQLTYLRASVEAQRAQLESTLDSAPTGIMFVDRATGHVMANPRAMELMGRTLSPDAGVEQYADQLRDLDGAPVRFEDLPSQAALRGETIRGREMLVRTPDGRTTPALLYAAPVHAVGIGILGVVVIFEELSAIKDLERLRDELSAVIAHDLRNPLHVIRMQIAMLKAVDGGAARMPREALERIDMCVSSMTKMTDDLVDAARVDAKRLAMALRTSDLEQLVRCVVARVEPALGEHRVEVSVAPGVPPVAVDSFRFDQILTNLLDNAAKFSPADAPVRIELSREADGARLSVVDRGSGVPPEDLPHIFERFHQGRDARARRTGLGLGLYIVKGLVEAHGGTIRAESTPGAGTTIHLWLPAASPPELRFTDG
jgi:signal transduction histidine kinase